MSKPYTLIRITVRMKNGDVHRAPWCKYWGEKANEILTLCMKVKELSYFKISPNRGNTRLYLNPDDISSIRADVKHGFWSLPLFRQLPFGE